MTSAFFYVAISLTLEQVVSLLRQLCRESFSFILDSCVDLDHHQSLIWTSMKISVKSTCFLRNSGDKKTNRRIGK